MCAWASRWRSTGSRARPFSSATRHDAVELAPEAELVAEQRHAALEGQGGERDAPAVARRRPTTLSTWVRAPSKNTSLNSLVRVSWVIGRTSTPGWSIGTRR